MKRSLKLIILAVASMLALGLTSCGGTYELQTTATEYPYRHYHRYYYNNYPYDEYRYESYPVVKFHLDSHSRHHK